MKDKIGHEEETLKGRVTAIVGGTSNLFRGEWKRKLQNESDGSVCVDDIRISGHPLPLPPGINGSRWGQVTSMSGIETGCTSPKFCPSHFCMSPQVCKEDFWKASCSCPSNHYLSPSGECLELQQCLYKPCLNGGTCIPPGAGTPSPYLCSCLKGYSGKNCEWSAAEGQRVSITGYYVFIASSLSFLLFVLTIFSLFYKIYKRKKNSKKKVCEKDEKKLGRKKKNKWTRREKTEEEEEESLKKSLKNKGSVEMNYFNERSGKLHRDSSAPLEAPLGLISDCNAAENKNFLKPNEENKTHFQKISPNLKESEISRILSGLEQDVSEGVVIVPQDDLRAYAYEGDESSSGSLRSAISGLRHDYSFELNIKPLIPEVGEAIDLLKHFPDAERSKFLSYSIDASPSNHILKNECTRNELSSHCIRGENHEESSTYDQIQSTSVKPSPYYIQNENEEHCSVYNQLQGRYPSVQSNECKCCSKERSGNFEAINQRTGLSEVPSLVECPCLKDRNSMSAEKNTPISSISKTISLKTRVDSGMLSSYLPSSIPTTKI